MQCCSYCFYNYLHKFAQFLKPNVKFHSLGSAFFNPILTGGTVKEELKIHFNAWQPNIRGSIKAVHYLNSVTG